MVQLQLQQLMETLNSTEPHYIRCVKPNNLLKPAIFENVNIMHQLRCGVSILLCSSCKSSVLLQLSQTLSPTGCIRCYQNQLCWLSYTPPVLWICEQIWSPCPRGHRSKVSILSVYILCPGGRKLWFNMSNILD